MKNETKKMIREVLMNIALAFAMTIGMILCIAAILGGCILISILIGCIDVLYYICPAAVITGMIGLFILIL